METNARYMDPSATVEARVADLLPRMLFEEKIAQMHAFWLVLAENGQHTHRHGDFAGQGNSTGIEFQLRHGLGQIARPLGSHSVDANTGVKALNRLQSFLVNETRLGIPAMSHEECLVGLMAQGATLFPSALAYGATWNPALIEAVGAAIGREARSIGCHQGLAPVLDVARDARWGRTEETLGEDPYHIGVLASRYVRGLQGPRRDLLATLKHYAGHSISEGARNHAPVNLGIRELNDTFMLPFEMAVALANPGSVMPAYHDIDREPCHASRRLLTEVLREQWGFNGLIVADYVGISLLYQHHGIARDAAEAAALAFNAGLDIELPGNQCAQHLEEALERGLIDMPTIDAIVSRILAEKFRIGMFEKPYTDTNGIALREIKTVGLAREVSQQSIVILTNKGVLPITPESGQRIAVIGPTADDPLAQLCGYSLPVHLIMSDSSSNTATVITPLAAFRNVFGDSQILYAKGCHILEKRQSGSPVFPGDVSETADETGSSQKSPVSQDKSLIPEALVCAAQADIVVVCVGDLAGLFQSGTVGEGSDSDSLQLPGVQEALLEALVATGKPVIAVLHAGRPYNFGGLEEKLAAIVVAFAGGEQGGPALVDVLTGTVEPSGRLTISVPRNVGAVPYFYNHSFKSGGTPIAFQFGSDFAFGHGLSYTEFEYSQLSLAETEVDINIGTIRASFRVKNTGKRKGFTVPQLYVRDKLATCVRPVRELKAFGRISLEPGEQVIIEFGLPTDMLNFTNSHGERIVEPGEFEIQIGESSAAIKLSAVATLVGEVRTLVRGWRMESSFEVKACAEDHAQ